MGLDINTPKGQESLSQEHQTHQIIKRNWKLDIIETPKDSTAACDGFLIKNGVIVALFETKCRNLTYNELINYDTWLITMAKIAKCKSLSKLLRVPFIGFLYLVSESNPILLSVKITNNKGEYLFEFEQIEEPTQANINGGVAVRVNAHIPVDKLKQVGVFIENV
jgi:hypothetical protein